VLIGLTDIDWHCPAFHTERQRILRIARNPASGSEVICSPYWDYSKRRPRGLGEIHQAVKHLVQCTVSASGNQQIRFTCFRRKPPCVSLFPSHSHPDVVTDCLLVRNCRSERVVAGDFAVKNQLNFSTSRPASHRLFASSRTSAKPAMKKSQLTRTSSAR
jgi:hypothetical protein